MSTIGFLEGDVNGTVFGTSGPVAAEWIGACCAVGHGFFVLFWLADGFWISGSRSAALGISEAVWAGTGGDLQGSHTYQILLLAFKPCE